MIISQNIYKSTQKYLDKLPGRAYTDGILKSYGGGRMINTDELRGMIARKRKSQSDVAKALGISPKTFYEKMKKGVFGSDEIELMIDFLEIEDPVKIFFTKK